MMRYVKYFLIFFIALIGITFTWLNATTVNVDFYLQKYELPLSMLLVYSLGSGLLFGWLIGMWSALKTKKEAHQLRKKIKLLETEVGNLRAMPLKDEH